MKPHRWRVALFIGLLATPLLVRGDTGADEAEQQRQRLEKYRADPEQDIRLRRAWLAFQHLPLPVQERIRQLDRDLHEEDSATTARLQGVMERYAEWLDRLPEKERQQILDAPDASTRLRLIRERRQAEWVVTLPLAVRQTLEAVPAEARATRIAELRREERQREADWERTLRHWDDLQRRQPLPSRLTDFPPEVQSYVTTTLLPMMRPEERTRLKNAEDQWPLYPQTLVELADAHPLRFPGPPTGPSRFTELPKNIQERLPALRTLANPRLEKLEGKWPDYAVMVVTLAKRRGITLPQPLGPSRPAEFSPAVQRFLTHQLLPRLTVDEKERLNKVLGEWPDYPRTLRDLARKHDLAIPGMALPGPREFWNRYRTRLAADGLPEVADATLREFMWKEMTAAQRSKLTSLSLLDPSIREQVKQAYFERYPHELKRLRAADQRKQDKKLDGRAPE